MTYHKKYNEKGFQNFEDSTYFTYFQKYAMGSCVPKQIVSLSFDS
jgi:hypothetical protein